ncbi:MAG: PEP-CTERM sorting domain-containing protein [Gemmataceae bacterium]
MNFTPVPEPGVVATLSLVSLAGFWRARRCLALGGSR